MKTKELRTHSDKELEVLLKEQQDLLVNLRFNHAVSPIENPARINGVKNDVARIHTLITERRHAANEKSNAENLAVSSVEDKAKKEKAYTDKLAAIKTAKEKGAARKADRKSKTKAAKV